MAGGNACSNCGTLITCGCQRERASDGKNCCTSCIKQYERSIGNGPKPAAKRFVWDIGKRR